MPSAPRALLVNGSMVSGGKISVVTEARKQLTQYRASSRCMMDVKLKLTPIRLLLGHALSNATGEWDAHDWGPTVRDYFEHDLEAMTPTLTEVVLATELDAVGLDYTATTFGALFADPRLRRRLLADHDLVLLSTTLLRDLSELRPIVEMLRRPGNRIVLGGALVGLLSREWEPLDGVDMLAVGYGERLLPGIAAWARSGYREVPPSDGYAVKRCGDVLLLEGTKPSSRNLDGLTTPDWTAYARRTGERPRMVRYESVRGCPYRCGFCSFPFVFDDATFRTKSARRIADEWQHYVEELGVEYITCFDSLFTMPRSRLRELCAEIVRRKLDVKWICYARADDLLVDGVLPAMREAGAIQVLIGAESGSQLILDNMNKRSKVDAARDAIRAARAHGIATIGTFIIGYPGETRETAASTYRLIEESQPDFYVLTVLNTRMEGVPLLEPDSKRRFALEDYNDGRTNQPYFRHATMDAAEAMDLVEQYDEQVRRNRISLWTPLFVGCAPEYRLEQREALLDYQYHLSTSRPWMNRIFQRVHRSVDRRFATQIATRFRPEHLEERAAHSPAPLTFHPA